MGRSNHDGKAETEVDLSRVAETEDPPIAPSEAMTSRQLTARLEQATHGPLEKSLSSEDERPKIPVRGTVRVRISI